MLTIGGSWIFIFTNTGQLLYRNIAQLIIVIGSVRQPQRQSNTALYSQPVDLQSFTVFFNSTLLFHNVILIFMVKHCTNNVNGNIL